MEARRKERRREEVHGKEGNGREKRPAVRTMEEGKTEWTGVIKVSLFFYFRFLVTTII